MSNESGLAAVHEAAGSISKSEHDKAVAAARTEGIAEGRTAGVTEGKAAGLKEGAEAERTRILGIEAHSLPGHEKLIAECKADPNCTPDMAAGRIVAAEKALRAGQAGGIAAVEAVTGAVGAAPASDRREAASVTPPQPGAGRSLDDYKADYAKSAQLQAEFASADTYAAYAKGVADGRIRILTKRPA